MNWQTRQIELPVRFSIYSLDWCLSEKQDFVYHRSVDHIQRLLGETKGITDHEKLEERLDDIKEEVDDLKEDLGDESTLESYLTSLNPEKREPLQLQVVYTLFHKKDGIKIDTKTLKQFKYFTQILRANNQRRIFGQDISDYSYIAKPFNEEGQLVRLINSVEIPKKYQNRILEAFEEVKNGQYERTGDFTIINEKRYHPVVSKLSSGIKYITTPAGIIIGGVGGTALGVGAGALVVGTAGLIVGAAGLLTGAAALVAGGGVLVAGGGLVIGVAYGASQGAKLGYYLQDRITGNRK